jgi:ubiquinol-cytochrome c reductase cytochrome c subunit
MRRAVLLCAAPLLATALAASAQVKPQAPAAAAGRADVGRTLFTKNGCFQCHGHEAQGGAAGPRLGPRPMPLAAFTAYVRSPRGDMPPYTAKVLSDRDLADMHAFLEGLPQPRQVKDIPLLSR